MTFVNSLDPDQAQHNVGPDLVQTVMVFLKDFFKNNFESEKNQQTTIKQCSVTQNAEF